MNFERYPWLKDLQSPEAVEMLDKLKRQYEKTGAVIFPDFLTPSALSKCVEEARQREDAAFTTDGTHTAHLLRQDTEHFPANSVRNHGMRTQVASIAFDELSDTSQLAALYQHPTLLKLVATIVQKSPLYLSEDPLGCCSINVFRPSHHHSFHFDESEFSTTLMLQAASVENTGLFQYTDPLRSSSDDLVLETVATVLRRYDDTVQESDFCEPPTECPDLSDLHTLEFKPGTLFIFSGSRSLHRVTRVHGNQSRLVAVLTFASKPGFRNTPEIQKVFWGRSYVED